MNQMVKFANLARMLTPTIGGGPMTLTTAVNSFLTFDQAGVQDGDDVSYSVDDGNGREVGRGIYNAAAKILTRNVLRSTNSVNQPILLTGKAQVSITVVAEDLQTIITDAPADGEVYGRQDNQWVALTIHLDGGSY